MKRRDFLKSSLAASCVPLALSDVMSTKAVGQQPEGRQFLEWRRYVLSKAEQRRLVSNFLEQAAIPALGRLNIGPVGVFTDMEESPDASIYTLTPFDSLEQFASVGGRLGADAEFVENARQYLSTEKSDPAYERIETQLMISFTGVPRVEVPRTGERLFELRRYESHNELKAFLKIEMFNEAELKIFRNVGPESVFFGQALAGAALPNLTYMLAYKDMAEREELWKAFIGDPDWKVLRVNERYQDTVSKIENRFLVPVECSQI